MPGGYRSPPNLVAARDLVKGIRPFDRFAEDMKGHLLVCLFHSSIPFSGWPLARTWAACVTAFTTLVYPVQRQRFGAIP